MSRDPTPDPVLTQRDTAPRRRIVLVTGMSGAGRTTALHALEDAGYEAVDNLPLTLMLVLTRSDEATGKPLAIGMDTRTRGFAATALLATIDRLRAEPDCDAQLLFLDCDDEVLRRRYTETRRRHPLAIDRPVTDGIRTERTMLRDLRDRAQLVIDTSAMTGADLKRQVQTAFSLDVRPGLGVQVVSFAYRNGLPRDADLVFDVRFLANPHYEPNLKALTGDNPDVAAFIERDPGCHSFIDGLTTMLSALLPRYESEGKSYLTIAIGCTGGRHRSVYVAERLVAWLRKEGRRCGVLHREMVQDRRVEDIGPGATIAGNQGHSLDVSVS
jgi:RNase adapter protein RapZ